MDLKLPVDCKVYGICLIHIENKVSGILGSIDEDTGDKGKSVVIPESTAKILDGIFKDLIPEEPEKEDKKDGEA